MIHAIYHPSLLSLTTHVGDICLTPVQNRTQKYLGLIVKLYFAEFESYLLLILPIDMSVMLPEGV